MRPAILFRCTLYFLVLYIAGCTAFRTNRQVADYQRPAEYVRFFEVLDETVKDAGVRDAADFGISGFPYLRFNRFLADLMPALDTDARRKEWVDWMLQLNLAARQKEIHNLAPQHIKRLARRLGQPADREIFISRAALYSQALLANDIQRPNFYQTLQAALSLPTEYSTALRVVGIYPLTSIPVTAVTRRLQGRFEKWHHAPVDQLDTLGELTAYGPSASGPSYSEAIVRSILERSSRNALGVPRPSIADQTLLLAMFAPIIYQDVAADSDEIGEVVWLNQKVTVNPAKPTVYHYLSHARLKGNPILQLNYVFWYRARTGPLSPRIERGPLDGLTVRVSLDPAGRPFMVDIMNNCGCYHYYVPRDSKALKLLTPPGEIDPFAPRRLPLTFPAQRLTLRVVSGWHQVDHLDPDLVPKRAVSYQLADYGRLEMLPQDNRTFESMFNSNGIAKDSPRIESLIFFPMGITDIGSMRQRGHHAVLFIGRAHFDDPNLFDNHFEF